MEIQNSQYIEIITTLEMIERANNAVKFHNQIQNPDILAIKQYQKLKTDYLKQLSELLSVYNIKIEQTDLIEV